MASVKIGDIAAPFVWLLLRTAGRYGVDTNALLQDTGITPVALQDADARIGIPDYMRLGHAAILRTGEPALGLRMGEECRLTDLGWPGLLAQAAPTIGEALACAIDYEALVSRNYRGHSLMQLDGPQPGPVFYSIAPYNAYNLFVVDAVLCWWHKLIERLSGERDLLVEVHVEFPAPGYQHRYQDIFGVPVLFGQRSNRLVLRREALALPNVMSEPYLYRQLRASAEERLKRQALHETFKGKVQHILGPMLHGNTPTIQDTAARLNMPEWTLRRKLKEEGCSFQELLDNMRKDLALGYMHDTALSLGEIAYVLGFSTPGAFQRAFKRWTGQTPGNFRQERMPDGGSS